MTRRNNVATPARIIGFSLLEISVVLALIGVITGMGLVTLTASLNAKQYNVSVARMEAIEKALYEFSALYNRIPCPGDLTLTPTTSTAGAFYATTAGADYGIEAGGDANSAITTGTGVCTGTNMTPQANFVATSGVAEGAVPVRTLQLPDDYMFDGWGRRFSYAVDPAATVANSVPGMAFSCSPITVMDKAGGYRSAAAIYALISHGANGHGAYTAGGTAVNSGSTNTDEWTNCHCNATGASQAYPWGSPVPTVATYVEGAPSTVTAGNPLTAFDDIVTFKENWQMQRPDKLATPSVMYIADSSNYVIRAVSATSQNIITTVAGTGADGFSGDGGPATSATLGNNLAATAIDSAGNFYIVDQSYHCVRKVTVATGIITTYAGTCGTAGGAAGGGGDGGPAASAVLNTPWGIAIDKSDNVYIADSLRYRIRKVTAATGIISTVAGTGVFGFSGDGAAATAAKLSGDAAGIALDSIGNLYIADALNKRVRKVTAATGIITTVAGNGGAGINGDGGAATAAQISFVATVGVDSPGNIYLSSSNTIRKVTAATGIISTFATLNTPNSFAIDNSDNFYVADAAWGVSRLTTTGTACTIVGDAATTGGYGGDGSPAIKAVLNGPGGVSVTSR